MRRRVEQPARRRVHTDELAAERHEVQVGLEDLGLGPAALERERQRDLPRLQRERARAACRTQPRVELRRELHRECARAAPLAARPGEQSAAERPHIDPAVRMEAAILDREHGFGQRRRDFRERRPGEPPLIGAHAPLVQQAPAPIEQARLAGRVLRAHDCEARGAGRERAQHERRGEREPHEPGQRATPVRTQQLAQARLRSAHGTTRSASCGSSPKLSGAYIASTRVGGIANTPSWLRRSVYSTSTRPFGTYWK